MGVARDVVGCGALVVLFVGVAYGLLEFFAGGMLDEGERVRREWRRAGMERGL